MYAFEPWESAQQFQNDLISICYSLKQQNQTSGVALRSKNLYESDFDFFKQDHPAVTALMEYCRTCVFEAANQANRGRWAAGARIGIDIHESWCHITPSGGYHDAHTHPNSAWSGIYYIRSGECDLETKNGVNRFYAPWIPTAYSDISTLWNSQMSSIDMPVEDGTMIIFPSWLLHSGMPYTGTIERVIVSFNCKFVQG